MEGIVRNVICTWAIMERMIMVDKPAAAVCLHGDYRRGGGGERRLISKCYQLG